MSVPCQSVVAPTSRAPTALVLLAVALGFVMAMLDVTVVNVALSDLQREFDVTLSSLVWVIDAYTLMFASFLLLGGALANVLGAKRAYMLGLAWFILASLLCGLATSAPMLIGARFLQGIGAALFMPSSLSLLTEAFPDRSTRIRMVGIWGAIVGAAAGSGPFIGGLLVNDLGWRSIFYLNLPIGLLGILLTLWAIHPSPRRSIVFNLPTHLLIMLTLAGLSFVLIEGPSLGWTAPANRIAMTVAAFGALAVILREKRSSSPVIPAPLRHNSNFWALNGLGFLINFALFGEIFLVALLLQQFHHTTALQTGAWMLPVMATVPISNYASGRFAQRFGERRVMLTGLSIAVLGSLVTACVGGGVAYLWIVPAIALCNAGMGLALPAAISSVMHVAGATYSNVAAASLNANRQIGALAGVAVMGIVLHAISDWALSVRIAFAINALVLLVGAWLVKGLRSQG
ncbi:MFS transporter [Pseudomonas gingeri]|uniref:MFS transporter n=1 Tax=Pseudomonas gingeri TaxID=117681 RepID=UPI0015A0A240|nr:MFS transporter [Pseudomonas gingeri]NVZ64739.1 MFS transporter [Pseudomonas gingeri]NVZ78196.1 MFS transporter [Pseudomonas gingeri]